MPVDNRGNKHLKRESPVQGISLFAATATLVITTLGITAPSLRKAMAEPCCDPAGPFAAADTSPRHPARCETNSDWIDRVPDHDGRLNMAISGRLTHVGSDGALAYLIMCPEDQVQVLCIAYQTNGMQSGDSVTFSGGYGRLGESQIVLDPCLAHRN